MKPIVSYTVQIIIPKFESDGTILLAIMPYTKHYGSPRAYTTLRLPAETGKHGESVSQTAYRGAEEEVAKDKMKFEVEIRSMASATLDSDQKNSGAYHAKISVVMEIKKGEIRNFSKIDKDDPDEFHGPLEWVEVSTLLNDKHPSGLKLISSHRTSIMAFMRAVTGKPEMKSSALKYRDLLNSFQPQERLTQEEVDAVNTLTKVSWIND